MAAWLNLIGNVVIIGTGGVVRLTASGLGCPTWPTCSSASWVPTSELSGHSLIEFANRMMSPVLGVLAVLLVVLAYRTRPAIRSVRTLSLVVLGGVLVQAVVGGITVLTGLNAAIVGFHFLCSSALVGVSAAILVRAGTGDGARALGVPGWLLGLANAATVVLAAVLVLGVMTTARGPHSGDQSVVRDGAGWQVLVTVHGIATALLVVLVVAIAVASLTTAVPAGFRNGAIAFVLLLLAQAAVGLVQAATGIPAALVAIHMVLSALLVAVATTTLLSAKRVVDA